MPAIMYKYSFTTVKNLHHVKQETVFGITLPRFSNACHYRGRVCNNIGIVFTSTDTIVFHIIVLVDVIDSATCTVYKKNKAQRLAAVNI